MILVASTTLQRPFPSWTFNEFKVQFGITAESHSEMDTFELDIEDFSSITKVEGFVEDIPNETMKLPYYAFGKGR